ncbi:MAG: GDSL-type esterase/lipase family protein [Acidobacteriota bacterium]|nr:GDSL-type esterase/lipase family protein [Blastocatellia bacterium]MDW8413059.1 GDSL-type esterase/lipase family protein [Acidobacteriota bacterium]
MAVISVVLEVYLRSWPPPALQLRMRRLEVDELADPALRSARRRKFNTMYADDEQLGYRLAENFYYEWQHSEYSMQVKTNSLALREEREFGPKNALRILTLGDSFVFGLGVQRSQTFQTFLERELSKRLSRPVEVINAGVPGYGTCHELVLLERLLPVLQPDLVLLCFYVGNDLVDNLHCLQAGVNSERIVDGVFVSTKRYHVRADEVERRGRKGLIGLLLRSYLYNLLEMKIDTLKTQAGVQKKPQTLYKSVYSFHGKATDQQARVYAYTRKQLEAMLQICSGRGTKLAVALLPAQLQVYEEMFAEQLVGFSVSSQDYEIDRPNKVLSEMLSQMNVPAIDLYEPFRERRGKDLYYRHDGHWTKRGHRLAAKILEPFLLGLIEVADSSARPD